MCMCICHLIKSDVMTSPPLDLPEINPPATGQSSSIPSIFAFQLLTHLLIHQPLSYTMSANGAVNGHEKANGHQPNADFLKAYHDDASTHSKDA